MKNENIYVLSYILVKYFNENRYELGGTFDRLPICPLLLEHYSQQDIKQAFEFLKDSDMVQSSIYEPTQQLLIFSINIPQCEFFNQFMWKEFDYQNKLICRNILKSCQSIVMPV